MRALRLAARLLAGADRTLHDRPDLILRACRRDATAGVSKDDVDHQSRACPRLALSNAQVGRARVARPPMWRRLRAWPMVRDGALRAPPDHGFVCRQRVLTCPGAASVFTRR